MLKKTFLEPKLSLEKIRVSLEFNLVLVITCTYMGPSSSSNSTVLCSLAMLPRMGGGGGGRVAQSGDGESTRSVVRTRFLVPASYVG